MACALMENGNMECQTEKIGMRTVDLTDLNLTGEDPETPEPTPAPKPPNYITTKVEGEPVNTKPACSTGDPHSKYSLLSGCRAESLDLKLVPHTLLYHPSVRSFDGNRYDCQGEGEFILVKSKKTQRQVQGRFEHMSTNRAISIGKGVAIQDEGNTPRVQLNMATLKTSLGEKFGSGKVQFFVDGEQRELANGSGKDDQVKVTTKGSVITVFYVVSEMKVTATIKG